MKKIVLLLSIVILCSCSITKNSVLGKNIDVKTEKSNHTIYVPDNYSTIQEAINNAQDNDLIFIRNGTYSGNIIIDREIALQGQSPEGVIILPDENSNAVGIEFKIKDKFEINSIGIIRRKNISISSIQIRNFENGIEIAYEDIMSISNCIIVSKSLGRSFWLQGAKVEIANCTIIGKMYIHDSECNITKNIIVNNALQYSNSSLSFLNEKAIDGGEKVNCTFTNNLIYGEVNISIGESNIFSNPQFENIAENNYITPFTSDGLGAYVLGGTKEEKIIDNNKPEIQFKNTVLLDDINIAATRNYDLSFVVYDESPIKKIKIFSEEIDCSKEFTFQRKKYKKEINRMLILNNGYNTINIEAIDYYGNSKIIELNILYGESTIPKSDWNNLSLSKENIDNFKNKIGLVIGIQKYSKDLPKLKYTEKDAVSMYDILLSQGYKMFEPLLNPSLNQMKEAFLKLEKLETKYDKVVIYISGHGSNKYSLFSDSNGLILPSDANIEMLSTTAMPIAEFRSYIKKLEASSVVIILDMCFAGSGKGYGTIPKNENINYITETLKDSGKGKILLASSGDLEVSYEDDEFQHGVFTYYLIEAIKNNRKSIDSIYEYIYNSILKSGKYNQKPRKVFLSDDVEGIHLLF